MTNTPIPFYKLGGEGIDGPKILGAIVALTGSEIYLCAKCFNVTAYTKDETRPIRCDMCSDDFSWLDIKTKLVRKCPDCGRVDKTNSKAYCSRCPSPVKLIDEESDITTID